MSDSNPYAPPTAALNPDVIAPTSLAPRGARLRAAFIDGALSWIVVFPLQHFAGATERFLKSGWTQIPTFEILAWAAFSYCLFAAVHWVPLSRTGQTWGKRAVGIAIVDMDGKKPTLRNLLLVRYLFARALYCLPYVGAQLALVDALFIFSAGRRCVHDHVARTRVVNFS